MMDFEQAQVWRRLTNEGKNYYSEAAEPEQEQFRNFFKGILMEGTATVEFEKSDGSTRVMICTLSDRHGAKYPTQTISESDTKNYKDSFLLPKNTTANKHVQKVWDCQLNQWRSFRWDRLRKVEFSIG